MNSKRSMWKLLLGVAGVGLLVTNCTLKTDDGCTPGKKKSGCDCPGNAVGYQTCQDDGTYDACECPPISNAGGSNVGGESNGGASNGGTASGGATNAGEGGAASAGEGGATSSAGEGGEGGEVIAPIVDPNDCYDCLNKFCTLEWDACAAEDEKNPQSPGDYCLSSKLDNSGQIEKIINCIEAERDKGLAKRDVVRACGSSLGESSDPSFFEWPPPRMTAATEGLMNCMADAPDEVDLPGRWADSTNIPASGSPKPWLDMTCAKLSCTSAH